MSTILKKYRHKIIEYIKFNIIGMSNFVISQGIYLTLFLYFKLYYLLAYTITSVISITASYILNSKYTFKEKKYSYKKFFYSILIYIFEYILNMGVIVMLVNVFKFGEILSPIIAPAFTTPPIFLLMRKVIKNS